MFHLSSLGQAIVMNKVKPESKKETHKPNKFKYFNFTHDLSNRSIPSFTQFINLDSLANIAQNFQKIVPDIGNILFIDRDAMTVYEKNDFEQNSLVKMVLYSKRKEIKDFIKTQEFTPKLTFDKTDLTPIGKLLIDKNYKIDVSKVLGANEEGDSDKEEKTDNLIRKFTLTNPLTPEYTTIWCKDGNLKGDTLIYNCQQIVLNEFNKYHQSDIEPDQNLFLSDEDNKNESVDPESKNPVVTKISDRKILRDLGNDIFENASVSEVNRADKAVDSSITSTSQVKFTLAQPIKNGKLIPITRLYYPVNASVLGYKISDTSEKDLSYADINKVNQHIIKHFVNLKINKPDKCLATLQLNRLHDTEYNENDLDLSFIKNNAHKEELIAWLDYLNVLLFRVEASRINNAIITGIMVLKLIAAGKMTYKEAFADSNVYGGQYPGASLYTGPGNLKARASLLSYGGGYGLRDDRQHPQWLAVTLKEAIVMINWLKMMNEINKTDPNAISRDEMLVKFRRRVTVMIKNYLQVAVEV